MTGDAVFAVPDAAFPRVTDVYWMSDGIRVRLTDGRLLRIPFGFAAALHALPLVSQRDVHVTTAGAAIMWPAADLTIPLRALLAASVMVDNPGPGETLPLDVTTRSEDWT